MLVIYKMTCTRLPTSRPNTYSTSTAGSWCYSFTTWFAALARSTAPGLGYGRCWNRGPAAVVSAPVFASLRLGRPLDHEPLQKQYFCSSVVTSVRNKQDQEVM